MEIAGENTPPEWHCAQEPEEIGLPVLSPSPPVPGPPEKGGAGSYFATSVDLVAIPAEIKRKEIEAIKAIKVYLKIISYVFDQTKIDLFEVLGNFF